MSATISGPPPWQPLRGTTDATIGDVTQIILPTWARVFTVEAPTGASNLKVARTGTDGDAIVANFVDVVAGAGPRVFITSGGQQSNEFAAESIYIASVGSATAFIVEAESARR